MLVMSVQAIANIIPFTPGGAGAQQALLVATLTGPSRNRRPLLLGRHPDRGWRPGRSSSALPRSCSSSAPTDWRGLIRQAQDEADQEKASGGRAQLDQPGVAGLRPATARVGVRRAGTRSGCGRGGSRGGTSAGVVAEQDLDAGGSGDLVCTGRGGRGVPSRGWGGRASRRNSTQPSEARRSTTSVKAGGAAPGGGQMGTGGDGAAFAGGSGRKSTGASGRPDGPGREGGGRRQCPRRACQRPAVGGDERVVGTGVG